MKRYKNTYTFLANCFCSLVCSTVVFAQSDVPLIGVKEAFKYEKQYLAEYEKVMLDHLPPEKKWIQPNNKSIPCKVVTFANQTEDEDYRLFWDGGCKDGFADGLGREIEKAKMHNVYQIGYYERGSAVGYTSFRNLLTNESREQYSEGHEEAFGYRTIISQNNFTFHIQQEAVYHNLTTGIQKIIVSSPFSDSYIYIKEYPNFFYRITDTSNDEFRDSSTEVAIYARSATSDEYKYNGFGFALLKNGNTIAAEFINGENTRLVQLPKEYYQNIQNIYNEIKEIQNRALDANQQATLVKKQYQLKICRTSVKVDFMDNEEYKDICNEEVDYEVINKKYTDKLEQISIENARKRDEINKKALTDETFRQNQLAQQRAQLRAREVAQQQAQAAQRMASAAERSARAAESANLNQSLRSTQQTIMQNMQNMRNNNSSNFQPSWSQPTQNRLQYCYIASGIKFCN